MFRSVLDLPGRAGWGQRYRELVAYRDAHGDCCVPKAQGTLGRWVARQRELRKKNALSSDREAKLAALGFVWNTNDSAWDARFEQLKEWKRRQGHACVPIAEGDLGVWVAKQRQLKRKEKLAPHREQRLDSINFVWDTPNTDWNEKYQALARWKTVCGDCRVPFNEGELGWWVNTQRQSKRKGKLSKEREDRLNEIGFIWNPQGVPPAANNNNNHTTPANNAQPNSSGATRSTSSGGAGSKRRSEDRSSYGGSSSKRHHSFSSNDSSAHNSFSYLPAPNSASGILGAPLRSPLYGASGNSSSASSVDEFYSRRDSDLGFTSAPTWRGGTSPSSAASVASSDQVLPPLNISEAVARPTAADTQAPPLLPSVYGVDPAPFNPVLPSLSAIPGPSFTASTEGAASAQPRRTPFERLPSVATLAAPRPTAAAHSSSSPFLHNARRMSSGAQGAPAPSAQNSNGARVPLSAGTTSAWSGLSSTLPTLQALDISAPAPMPSPRSAHGSVAGSPRGQDAPQPPLQRQASHSRQQPVPPLVTPQQAPMQNTPLQITPQLPQHAQVKREPQSVGNASKTKVSSLLSPSPDAYEHGHGQSPFGSSTAASPPAVSASGGVRREPHPFRGEVMSSTAPGPLGEPFGFAARWGGGNSAGGGSS